mgnify:FL=1
MRKIILCVFFIPAISIDSVNGQHEIWKTGTASTLEQHHLVVGQLQPSRYGITDRFEISGQVGGFIFFPNVTAKYRWYGYQEELNISSRHTFYYPTPGLRWSDKVPIFPGVHDHIPHIMAFRNELLRTDFFRTCRCCPFTYALTYKLGIHQAKKFGDNPVPLINKPLYFLRMNMLNGHYLWNAGIDIDGNLTSRSLFSFELDYYRIFNLGIHTIEQESYFIYHIRKDVRFFLGYRLSWNPNILQQSFQIVPLYDIGFHWYFRPPPENGFEWN